MKTPTNPILLVLASVIALTGCITVVEAGSDGGSSSSASGGSSPECDAGSSYDIGCFNCGTMVVACSDAGAWQWGTCEGQHGCDPDAIGPACDDGTSQFCDAVTCTWSGCI
jgi:hypothetical protein